MLVKWFHPMSRQARFACKWAVVTEWHAATRPESSPCGATRAADGDETMGIRPDGPDDDRGGGGGGCSAREEGHDGDHDRGGGEGGRSERVEAAESGTQPMMASAEGSSPS